MMNKLVLKEKQPNYFPAHIHDSHSLLDAIGDTEEYVKKAKSLGMKSITITNHHNVNSILKLQEECEKHNLKSVVGCELYVVKQKENKEKGEKRLHLTVWVKSAIGYKNLLNLLSTSNLYGYYYRPRCSFSDILEKSEGLLFGSGCAGGVLSTDEGTDFFLDLQKKTNSCFLEIMPHELDIQDEINKKCLELNKSLGIPLIASSDAHYVEPEDAESHEVMLAIQTKSKWSDPKRWRFTEASFFMPSYQEMIEMFAKQNDPIDELIIKKALKNTNIIGDVCTFRVKKRDINLPSVPLYKNDSRTEEEILIDICEKSFEKKYGERANFKKYLKLGA